MSVGTPHRPPFSDDPVDREALDALVRALIEEARRRARRRRIVYAAGAAAAALVAVMAFVVFDRTAHSQDASPAFSARPAVPTAAARSMIAFIGKLPTDSTDPRNSALYVVRPDGSGKRLLTRTAMFLTPPVWSPDGRTIAFPSARRGNQDIYVLNAGGRGERRMTRHRSDDGEPAWSPDGRQIAFVSDRGTRGLFELYVVNVGGGERRLTPSGTGAAFPAWSPDGRRIAFTGKGALYVVDADGGGLTMLAPKPRASDLRFHGPIWSPDGRKIAFVSVRDFRPGPGATEIAIYVVNADGGGLRRLTHYGQEGEPTWSPDGSKIAFGSIREGHGEIYVMNADGAGKRNLTRHIADDSNPLWSPDGRQLAFITSRDYKGTPEAEIYVMNADGSGQRNVSRNPGVFDGIVAWSPTQQK